MLTTVVLTFFGPDRPGLVEVLSACVTAHDGNWLESRLLHLGGHFTGIVRVELDESRREAFLAATRALAAQGLNVVAHDAGRAQLPEAAAGTSAVLELVGQDRPGIVREMARVLASRGVNVEELVSERTSAPMSGELMFRARAEVTLPAGVEAGAMRRDLEKIAADLMVDVSLTEHTRRQR